MYEISQTYAHVGFEGCLLNSEELHDLFGNFGAMRNVAIGEVIADVNEKVAKLGAVDDIDRLRLIPLAQISGLMV